MSRNNSYIEEKEEIERSQSYQMFYENSIIVQKKIVKISSSQWREKKFSNTNPSKLHFKLSSNCSFPIVSLRKTSNRQLFYSD